MKHLLPFFFLLLLSNNTDAQDKNFYTLDIVSFFTARNQLIATETVDLQGSSVTPMHNYGMQFILKKRYPLSKSFSYSLGAGGGYALTGYNFISTPEFNSVDYESPYAYENRRISIDGVVFVAGIAEIGYSFQMNQRSFLFIDTGLKVSYARRTKISMRSGTRLNSGISKTRFTADLAANRDNLLQFALDWSPYYVYQFKNSPFGIKAGMSVSFSPSKPVRGEVVLYGDNGNYVAENKGSLSFLGVSVGALYFPDLKKNQN